MAKVYEFPMKKDLPEHIKEGFHELGKDYIKAFHEALTEISSEEPTQEELDEIAVLIHKAFATGMSDAIVEYEKEL